MSKSIDLTKGQIAIIDDDDYERVSKYSWYSHKSTNNTYYARSKINKKGIYLHRFIMKVDNTVIIDHINGNKLDNRKCNLRQCNYQQNGANRKSLLHSSKFKGVTFRKKCKKRPWEASIQINGITLYLGNFSTELDAAKKYNEAAIREFGEFAKINILDK